MNQTEYQRALDQVTWLREAVSQGLLFPTLPDELAALYFSLPRHPRTPVTLPTITAEEQIQLGMLAHRSEHQEEPLTVTGADWTLAINQLNNEVPRIRFDRAAQVFNAALAGPSLNKADLLLAWDHFARPAMLLSHVDEARNRASVTRSATVTALAVLLYADRTGRDFLDQQRVSALVNLVSLGLLWERDHRGFVNQLGWIQLFGEYTLLLNELSQRPELRRGSKVFTMGAYLTGYRFLKAPLTMGEADEGADYLVRQLVGHSLYRRFFLRFLREWQLDLVRLRPRTSGEWDRVFNYRRLMQGLLMHPELPAKVGHQITDQQNFPGQ